MSSLSSDNHSIELSCQLCKTSHSSEWELKEHLWSLMHHVKLEQKAKNSAHQCVLCQTSADNLVDYGRHLNDKKHKQALEKAKEKIKPKPKLSHPRNGLAKIGKSKSKRTLLPNPSWHLDPVNQHSLKGNQFQPQLGKWRPAEDWQWNTPKQFNSFEHQNDYYTNNNNNNNNGFYTFSSSHWHKNQSWAPNNGLANSGYKYQNFGAVPPKYMFPSNNQKLKRELPINKAPPLAIKNSNSKSNSGSQPLASSAIKNISQVADNTRSISEKSNLSKNSKRKKAVATLKVKVNPASPQIQKLKLKITGGGGGGIVKTASVKKKKKKKKKKPLQKELPVIDKKSAVNAIEKGSEKLLADVSSSSVASAKESDDVSANKKHPSISKTRSQPLSKNSKSIKVSQNIDVAAKTKNVSQNESLVERKSSANSKDSIMKTPANVNAKEDAVAPLKRNFNSVDSSSIFSSSLNTNKKQKTLTKADSLEMKNETVESNSSNLPDKINSDSKPKDLVENNSSKQNKNSDKEKPPGILSCLTPTPKEKGLLPSLPLGGNENGFKVNKEVVSKLHKNLIGQNLIKSKPKDSENVSHSKEDPNASGKQSSPFVRQEELVKMMKPSRLNRKEKMHLSSLLQSYTKSQNKKLAVPRLTMQLSGLYDNSSSNNNDNNHQDLTCGSGISELELPPGMEEQIAYLIKKENLETVPSDDNSEKRFNLASLSKLNAKKKTTPTSVNPKGSNGQKKKQPNNSQPAPSSPPQPASDIGGLNIQSDIISPPVEPCSSQTNDISSISSTLPSLPETSSQTNSSVPTTTVPQPNSSPNLTASSNDSNAENVFNKVYLLTLREEEIRSSIIDMNEKMNYLNKLIIDSQMALQGCCEEHKHLLVEETNIREQRLQILQEAMNNKNSNADTTNTGPSAQPTHASQPVQSAIAIHPTEPTFSQTDSGQQESFIPVTQPTLGSKVPNSTENPAFHLSNDFSTMISRLKKKDSEKKRSWPYSSSMDTSSNTSTFQPLTQSHASPDTLHSDGTSSTQPVHRNVSSKQNQNNTVSQPNPVDTISLSSDTATSTAKVVSKKNTDKNISLNINLNPEFTLGFQPVTIKQELPSPSTPSPGKTLTVSEGLSPSNTNKNHVPSAGSFLEGERLPKGRRTNNITDTLSDHSRKQELLSAATKPDSMFFDKVKIKNEPLTPPPSSQAEEKNTFFGLESADKNKEPIFTNPMKEREMQRERTQSSNRQTKNTASNNSREMSSKSNDLINAAGAQTPLSAPGKTPKCQPVINFESVQIKKEPVSPPPDTEVKNEDTFFIPQMRLTDRNNEHPNPLKQKKTESDTEKTVLNNMFSSSESNLLGSRVQNEKAGTVSSMSTTYLGSMPNNFLDQLTLSWKKQNMSATTNEVSSSIHEHSLSDNESVSDHKACSFVQKSPLEITVPSRMNPRVCLEPLNLKFHRKRTLSEPVSATDSNINSIASDGETQELQSDQKMRSFVKWSLQENHLKCAESTDSVEESEGPKVKRKNLRARAYQTEKSLKTPSDPLGDMKTSALDTTSTFLNIKQGDTNLGRCDGNDFKEFKPSNALPEDSPMTNDSDIKSEFSVTTLNDLSAENPNSSNTAPLDANCDSNFPANPMNILNNLSMLHVVRTKKFPRTHLNGSQLPTFEGGAKSPANGLYIFENHLYASYQGSSPCKFSINTGECLQVYNCTPYNVQCMLASRISKNKSYLFSGGASELLLVFDELTGKLCSRIDTYKKIYSLHENWGSLFVGLSEGGVTKINLKSLRKVSELSYGSKPINCLATCTEGAQKLLCVGAYDASILIVDAMTGLLLKTLNCYQRLLYSIKVHQNLIFSCSSDKTLQVHDITSGKLLRCLQDHSSTISCLHVEDNLLVTGSHDKRINVYNSSNPHEAPVIFFAASKEPVSCLAVHNQLIYCGNFFGQIETIQFDPAQKWVCKYNSCELVFGQRKGLFYHLVNQHLQMTGLDQIKCLWQDCDKYICSVLDITEHCENHLNQILQPV